MTTTLDMSPATQQSEEAAHRLMQAQRTLEPEALQTNWLSTQAARAAAATRREAARQEAIGPGGRYDEDQAGFYSHL